METFHPDNISVTSTTDLKLNQGSSILFTTYTSHIFAADISLQY